MKKIRYGTFETNSSSTHAIVVPKKIGKGDWDYSDGLDHGYGFGRQECRLCDNWDEKFAYAYMILKGNGVHLKDLEEFVSRANQMFKSDYYINPNSVASYMESDREDGNITGHDYMHVLKNKWDESYGKYVDHSRNVPSEFIDKILHDDEFLERFLFNRESYITICGDEYRGYNIKTIGFEHDYDSEGHDINESLEEPPADWFDEKGCVKDKYFKRYMREYPYPNSDFWKKLIEYKKDNDVYLKGN